MRSRPPSNIKRHRGIITIIGVGLFVLLLLLYFAPYGLRNYLTMHADLNQVNNEISELKAKNKELTDEINLLKNDANYVERIARQKLGMLKKNEIVFDMPEKKAKNK